jgi:hypothetical protein
MPKMSKKGLLAAAFLGAVAGFGLATPEAAADPCLEVRGIKYMHVVGPEYTTMIVKDRLNRQYLVRFTGACKVGDAYSLNHFVYDEWHLGRCLDARDTLPTSRLGACFVDSVERIEQQPG